MPKNVAKILANSYSTKARVETIEEDQQLIEAVFEQI